MFFFQGYGDHRDLHVLTQSCPTRRSSDLERGYLAAELALAECEQRAAGGFRSGHFDRDDMKFPPYQVGARRVVVGGRQTPLALAALGIARDIAIIRHRRPRAARSGSLLRRSSAPSPPSPRPPRRLSAISGRRA